jgi:hypothetical protein
MDGAVAAIAGVLPHDAANMATASPQATAVILPGQAVQYTLGDAAPAEAGQEPAEAGACLEVEQIESFVTAASRSEVAGMPQRKGNGFPGGKLCDTRDVKFTLTFGPFRSDQCGSYVYQNRWQLPGRLDQAVVKDSVDISFKVTVEGCP